MTNIVHKALLAGVAVVTLGAAASASAQSQLTANAGLTSVEARGLTLTEIAAAKFSRNAGHENRQIIVQRGDIVATSRSAGGAYSQLAASAGVTPEQAAGMTLTEVAVAKFNRNAGHEARQDVARRDDVAVGSRSVGAALAQLAAGAGLAPEESAGMTLTEVAAEKFGRDTYN